MFCYIDKTVQTCLLFTIHAFIDNTWNIVIKKSSCYACKLSFLVQNEPGIWAEYTA